LLRDFGYCAYSGRRPVVDPLADTAYTWASMRRLGVLSRISSVGARSPTTPRTWSSRSLAQCRQTEDRCYWASRHAHADPVAAV